jgi:hypothetical protein
MISDIIIQLNIYNFIIDYYFWHKFSILILNICLSNYNLYL